LSLASRSITARDGNTKKSPVMRVALITPAGRSKERETLMRPPGVLATDLTSATSSRGRRRKWIQSSDR
jgi:hypothetical protein